MSDAAVCACARFRCENFFTPHRRRQRVGGWKNPHYGNTRRRGISFISHQINLSLPVDCEARARTRVAVPRPPPPPLFSEVFWYCEFAGAWKKTKRRRTTLSSSSPSPVKYSIRIVVRNTHYKNRWYVYMYKPPILTPNFSTSLFVYDPENDTRLVPSRNPPRVRHKGRPSHTARASMLHINTYLTLYVCCTFKNI